MEDRIRIVVLLSGGGRSLQYLHEQSVAGSMPAEIVRVISSRPRAKGVSRARDMGYEPVVVERKGVPQAEFDARMTAAVDEVKPDLVCMAGFLAFWTVPSAYEGRVMNIHPALLPMFGGKGFHGHHVHEAVLEAGESESGCTVHFADNQYDHGPIILQRRVPVLASDDTDALAERVFAEEAIAYPEAIRLFAEGRLTISGEQVLIG